jgi:hypothetical protein
MSLTEEQIALYGRQILVTQVGGVGQQKLCAASVRVEGSDIASRYLAAGGTRVLADGAGALSVGAAGFAWMLDTGCPDCHARTAAQLKPTDDVEQGALAALAFQRAVLGLAEPQGAAGVPLLKCGRHG